MLVGVGGCHLLDEVLQGVEVLLRLEILDRFRERGQAVPGLRRCAEFHDVPGIQRPECESQRRYIEVAVHAELHYLIGIGTGLHAESDVSAVGRVPHRTVFTVGVDDHAGDVVLHQLLYYCTRDVALAASGPRHYADVALDHAVDVQHDLQVGVPEHADVGAPVCIVLQAQRPLDEIDVRNADVRVHLEGRPGHDEQAVVVPVPYDTDGCDDLLLDRRTGIPVQAPVQGVVGLPDDAVNLTENGPAVGVADHDVIGTLRASRETEFEGVGTDVTEHRTDYGRILLGVRFYARYVQLDQCVPSLHPPNGHPLYRLFAKRCPASKEESGS